MTDDLKFWLPPMLTLLGTVIVIVFTAWTNSRTLLAQLEALRQEVRAEISGVKLEFHTALLRIENKVDRVLETQATHSERLDRLERK